MRPWEDADADALVAGINRDPEITAWLELIPQPYTIAEARMWISLSSSMWRERTGSSFALVVDGEAIGGVGINWVERDHEVGDIGYWLRQAARGRGYTTRGVVLAAKWAFEIGCERLQLRADAENEASQRVAERAGFTREGIQRSARYNPRLDRRMNFVVYSLLPGEL